MEPFPAPRATRFLLLQKGQLMRSDLTMLNAQMFNHSLHAHMVRDRLHLGQLTIPLEPLNLVSVRAYSRRDCHDGRGGVLFAAAKFLLSQAIASAQQSRRAREIEEAAQLLKIMEALHARPVVAKSSGREGVPPRSSSSFPPPRLRATGPRGDTREPSAILKSP